MLLFCRQPWQLRTDSQGFYLLLICDNRYYEKVGSDVKDITDEINFDLPNGWEYVRLFSLGVLGGGYTPKQDELNPHGLVPYFKVADMNSAGNEKYLRYTNNYLAFKPKKVFPSNSIVFPKNGGAVFTNKKRILTTDSVVDLNTGVFTPTTLINFDYAYLIFSTIDFREYYKGTALPTINNEFMRSIIFGLPPLVEQARIVSEIEKFEPLIAEYDKLEQQATKLDDEIYDKLKKSILQYAIQGKLVPQDPNDEPASELLERIRTEKRAKLGKKYVDSYIYKGDDNCYYEHIAGRAQDELVEVPFDIPYGWSWCRLAIFAQVLGGKRIPAGRQLTNENTGHYYIKVSDMKENTVCLDKLQFVPTDIYPTISRYIINKEDVYITVAGTIGRVGTIPNELDGANLTENADRIVVDEIDQHWLVKCLLSDVIQEQIKEATTKVGQPKLAIARIEKFLIPLPPLAEQKRIVAKINEIFAML